MLRYNSTIVLFCFIERGCSELTRGGTHYPPFFWPPVFLVSIPPPIPHPIPHLPSRPRNALPPAASRRAGPSPGPVDSPTAARHGQAPHTQPHSPQGGLLPAPDSDVPFVEGIKNVAFQLGASLEPKGPPWCGGWSCQAATSDHS